MNIFGRFLCALPRKLGGGHKRRKRLKFASAVMRLEAKRAGLYILYCPRCGEQTRYCGVRVVPVTVNEPTIVPTNTIAQSWPSVQP